MEPTRVLGRRVAAFLVDGLLVTAVNAALFFALATKQSALFGLVATGQIAADATLYGNITIGDDTWSVYGSDAALYFGLVCVVFAGYWVVLQGLTGWTLGKRLLGIRLVRDDGSSPAGVGRTLLRQVCFLVDAFPYLVPYLLGFVLARTSERRQRIGDRAAGTLVVRAP